MLTISQLAAHVGCTTKAVRVYHARGLLDEPERDSSGYRRYGAEAVIELTRIVTLVRAGVPLAKVHEVLTTRGKAYAEVIARIDRDLGEHIADLQSRRKRLAHIYEPENLCLPPAALAYMERFRALDLSADHEKVTRDGWILAYALVPDLADAYLPIRMALLDDDDHIAVLRAYDDALGWDASDPRLEPLAEAAAELSLRITLPSDLAEWAKLPPEAVHVLVGHAGVQCAAWRRMDELVAQKIQSRSSP